MPRHKPIESAFALPIAFGALLVLGAVASSLHGTLGAQGVLASAAFLTGAVAAISEPAAVLPLIAVAWLTVMGFSQAPYGQLAMPWPRALSILVWLCAAGASGAVAGLAVHSRNWRAWPRSGPEVDNGDMPPLPASRGTASSLRDLVVAVSRRRQFGAVALGLVLLPLTTGILTSQRTHLNLTDDLLLYLVLVMTITVIGGFWAAVVAAAAASVLLNWFFTPPLHHWSIDSAQNLVALLLFITVAVTASGVVHVAARRASISRSSQAESATLLGLAQTVLGGHDNAYDVLQHLLQHQQVVAELQERSGGRWVLVAAVGEAASDHCTVVPIRHDLRLRLFGDIDQLTSHMIDGYAAQAAAALDRERLRVQAAQAEILGAGNRMRTALLAAVSHDLRTPLSSVKAGVSALRQSDVVLSPDDRAELLATVEENTDRLDGLIANLLDMSRIQTGSVNPLLRPVSIDEIAPLALKGLDSEAVLLDLPDGLPTVMTDPGLLERAVANLVANAVRYSPLGQPPRLRARHRGTHLVVDVVDHGPGVDPADRNTMFLPFQQVGDRRNAGGVGLGLAVARGFVEAMGGSLTAHSTPGGGLTMRIELAGVEPADSVAAAP